MNHFQNPISPLLHGVGGTEINLADLATALDTDTLIVLPRGPLEFAPGNTMIAGFSQGGIMSASVALSAPEHVAGFAVLSGRIKLPVMWAQRSDQWLDKLGVTHVTRLYPIDHEISAAMKANFLAWVREQTSSETEIRRRYSAVGSGIPDGVPIALLHIGADQTTITTGSGTEPGATLTLAIGSQKTANYFLNHVPPTPFDGHPC